MASSRPQMKEITFESKKGKDIPLAKFYEFFGI